MEQSQKNKNELLVSEFEEMVLKVALLESKVVGHEHFNKLKDEFVTIVSHEIRTPLTIIKGNISNLMDGVLGGLTEKQMQVIAVTNRNVDRLMRLVNSLLDFSNMENGFVTPRWSQVDMILLVQETLTSFEPVAKERKINLKGEIPQQLPTSRTDPDLAVQILTNLIDHALQFAKKEATVKVEALGSEIRVTIMDDGPEISDGEPGMLFSKQVSIHRPAGSVGHRGTGLALALCQEKAHRLHGKICVEKGVDGSKVHLILPGLLK